jgi:hypothetical protein
MCSDFHHPKITKNIKKFKNSSKTLKNSQKTSKNPQIPEKILKKPATNL